MSTLNDINILVQVPVFTFWKDLNSKFLGCNTAFAHALGFEEINDIVGKTDYDLIWGEEYGDLYRDGDQKVLNGNPQIGIKEPQVLPDNKYTTIILNKKPLLDDAGQAVGIIGSYMEDLDSTYFGARDSSKKNISITKKQGECLYFLAQGLPTKLIADQMHLSSRTIEHYIETLKFKLHCSNKYQLMLKALALGFIRERLIRDGKW